MTDTFRLPLSCSKGCGIPVMTDMETVRIASEAGVPLVVAHDVCPTPDNAAIAFAMYRVTITVDRVRELEGGELDTTRLAQVGKTLEGSSFEAVADAISKELTAQWAQVLAHKNLLELGDFPQTVEDPVDNPGS